MEETPELIGTVETASILRLERSNISRLVADGRLKPALKLAGPTGAYLFKRSDVEAFAASGEAPVGRLADGEPSKAAS